MAINQNAIIMKKEMIILAAALLGIGMASAQEQEVTYSDLIISEYVEGSGQNKALELYNGTGADVDLSAYSLMKQTNGAGEYTNEVALTGTLAAGATYVIVNSGTSDNPVDAELAALADLTENKITAFNGDDAVALFKNGEKIDEVGVFNCGKDNKWGEDVTLRRIYGEGPTATYDPSEWTEADKDDFSDVGKFGADVEAPSIRMVTGEASDPNTIMVHVTELLDSLSAVTVSNYSLDNGATVDSAIYESDREYVVLKTSALTPTTEYTLTVNGVTDRAGNAMNNATYTFTFGYIDVADLAALNDLRDSYVEGQAYRITNPVVVTAVIGKFGSGQNTTNVWVQDQGCETTLGHSMMLYRIEENASNLQVGSVINNLIGQLTVYNDLVEMQYIDEASMEITGETADVVVTTVTIAELLGENAQSYQNALVRIDNVLFADKGAFVANESYNISDENNTIVFRTNREGSYIGMEIPADPTDVVGYVGWYGGQAQISPRMREDIGATAANEPASRIEVAVYPNPTDGELNVRAEGRFDLNVYSVNGTLVLAQEGLNAEARIDLSGLSKGVYMVEVKTAEGSAMNKVVVR